MAVQNIVEQHIFFITNTGQYDETSIMANSLIQSFANNAVGRALVFGYKSYSTWNGSTWNFNNLLDVFGYVSVAFQATIQANIPALQAAFPQYTITTEGINSAFGF